VETGVVKSVESLPVAVHADSLKGKVAAVKRVEQENAPSEAVTVADKMPEYPGGIKSFMDMMMSNMVYPEKAKQEGTEGRVIVQFDVNVDGTLSDVNVIRSVSPELDAEAVRLIGLSEKWTPGESNGVPAKVKYTVPVSFRLTGSAADTKTSNAVDSKLVIVDGKVVDKSELNSIAPSQIESMTVFKGDDAVAKYGEDAKNGAIVITLKK
jgi:TonB family protein